MKKIFGIVLSFCLIVSFVSCDFNLKKEEDKPEQKQEQEEKPSEEKKTEEQKTEEQKPEEQKPEEQKPADKVVNINPNAAATRAASLDFIFNKASASLLVSLG